MKRSIVGLVTVLALILSLLPAVAEAESENKYVLEVKLNYERAFLEVRETVSYTNKTPKELTSIVFNVTPAHFRAFNLEKSLVDGMPVEPRIDGVVLELPLPKPLAQRQTTQIELEFALDVPQQGGRFGMNERVLALGNWYPVLAVYGDGWDRHRHNAFGDPFFTEVGDYDVVLDVSSSVKVAHSGDLVSQEGNTWRMKGQKLRDFALAISDRYETRSIDVNGVSVTAFYLPEHRPAGSLYLEATERGLKWLGERLGAYPYKSLHIAETVSTSAEMVGQEYPGLVFISSSLADKASGMTSYLAYLVVHEVAHEWFYAIVGNDQMYDGWMDEAMATYLSYQVLEWSPLTLNSPSVIGAGNSPVNSSIYDFNDEGRYSATVYGKGTVFLQELSATLGSENFYKMLRRYVELHRHKIATPQDFFSLAQSFSATNLNPLIRKYFSYPEYKADSAPKLDVKWPSEDRWTGSVNIEFETNRPVQKATVFVDSRTLLSQDSPSSPLNIDISQLEDDEYVIRVTVRDDKGGVAQQAHRVRITNPRPTPTRSDQTAQTNRSSGEVVHDFGNIVGIAGNIDLGPYVFYAGFLMAGFVGLLFVASAIRYVTKPSVHVEHMPKTKKEKGTQNKPMGTRPTETKPLDIRPLEIRPLGKSSKHQSALSPPPSMFIGQSRPDPDEYGKRGAAELEELEGATRSDRITIDRSRIDTPPRQEGQADVEGEGMPFPADFQPRDS